MKELIKKIIIQAINAPSGDNSQPWDFEIRENSIEIFNLPKRDNPIFNYLQRGSYIAHGALIENICLLATHSGCKTTVNLFPDKNNINHTATILIEKDPNAIPNTLADFIALRCTNRKKYSSIPLEKTYFTKLVDFEKNYRDIKLKFTTNDLEKKILAEAASTAERIMLQYKPLHEAFFSAVRWSRKEEELKQTGLYINTLELLPPQKLIFKWLSFWNASKILRIMGLPKFIAKENAKIYNSSGAFAAILITNPTAENFIKTGMFFQKIWLTATADGLSIQPTAGVLFLAQRLSEEPMENLSDDLVKLINIAKTNISKVFNPNNQSISMMFRIGYAEQPTAKSTKFIPEIRQTLIT